MTLIKLPLRICVESNDVLKTGSKNCISIPGLRPFKWRFWPVLAGLEWLSFWCTHAYNTLLSVEGVWCTRDNGTRELGLDNTALSYASCCIAISTPPLVPLLYMYMNNHVYRNTSDIERKKEVAKSKEWRKKNSQFHKLLNYTTTSTA